MATASFTPDKRSSSAVFSLVSADSAYEEDAEDMMREALEVELAAAAAAEKRDSLGDDSDSQRDSDQEDASDEDSDSGFGGADDDDEEEEDSGNFEDGDLVDAGLAAAQDSVKTVITQSFRACAFAADSVASLVLKAHDFKNEEAPKASPKGQAPGASSAEFKSGLGATQAGGPARESRAASAASAQGRPEDEFGAGGLTLAVDSPDRSVAMPSPIPQAGLDVDVVQRAASASASSLDGFTTDGNGEGADEVPELPSERAIEREEKRLNAQQGRRRNVYDDRNRGMPPSNVSSEAFAALFHELDDSIATVSSTGPTPPRRLPSDFQLSFLNSSSSDSEMPGLSAGLYMDRDGEDAGTGGGDEAGGDQSRASDWQRHVQRREEDAPPTDSDTYTEEAASQSAAALSGIVPRRHLTSLQQQERDKLQHSDLGDKGSGLIQVSVKAISRGLARPINMASSLLFRQHGNVQGAEEVDGPHWAPSPATTPYYFTPPITPFGSGRNGQLRGFRATGLRTSFRKVSLGSFNSLKDAISSWRNSQRPIHTAGPTPNASTQQSGLFEDIEMFLLERVDLTFYAARHLVKRIKKKRFYVLQRPAMLSRRSGWASADESCGTPQLQDWHRDEGEESESEGEAAARERAAAAAASRHRAKKRAKRRGRKPRTISLSSFLKGMITLRIPLAVLRSAQQAASSLLLSPFSFLDSATRQFVHLENVDELKGIGKIVHRQGYPFQELRVVTNDGYVLTLDRLPNPSAKKVAMLVHGVMDSSFTYICNGADSSLAFRLHDEGYDVYLTNFRGVGGAAAHRHVRSNISAEEFWDFSINEHAFEDIPCFVRAIVRTKMSEFSSNNEPTARPSIVAVAHSMGGAVMLMYALNQRENKLRHFLDGMVLVSPAGIHSESPLYARIGGRAVDLTVARMVNSLRLPTDALTRATVKIVQDIKNSVPALEDIISLVVVYALGGDKNQPRRGPFSAVQQLTYNVLTCGTSTKVYTHLRQFIASKQFKAFDYEPSACPNHFSSKKGGNMEHYGAPEPPEYTSRYHLLDLPVHLIAGLDDQLIGPSNVLRHYDHMKRHGVDVTFESFERCGHADFTCGLHSKALQGILAAVDRVMDKVEAKKATLKELQRKKLLTPHY